MPAMVIAVMTTINQNILTNFLLLVEIWAKPWIVDDSSFSRNMLNSTMVNVEWMNSSARVPKQICIKICLYCSVIFCTLLPFFTKTLSHQYATIFFCWLMAWTIIIWAWGAWGVFQYYRYLPMQCKVYGQNHANKASN